MMKRTFLVLLGLAFVLTSRSQNQTHLHLHQDPYVLVDSFTTDTKHMMISANHIKEVNVLKGSIATKTLGDKARNGAVIITTKPGTTLLRLNQILDKYNIPEADRKLRVCINETLVSKPELIIADMGEIQAVEITADRYWQHAEDADSNERFINIKAGSKK
jgi:hypothetical protein